MFKLVIICFREVVGVLDLVEKVSCVLQKTCSLSDKWL